MTILVSLQTQLAHEIRNSLEYLRMITEQLKIKYSKNSELTEELANVNLISDNIEKLVYALNDVYCAPRKREFNLCEIIWEQVSILESVMELKSINFHYSGLNNPIYIIADPNQIGRSLINFIKNAYEACRRYDGISINVTADNVRAVIEVRDTGIGMTQEVKESLFTPFFTTKETGTGIGAYIAKSIIENHGGSVEVESELGKGTTIVIRLPL